MELCLDSNSERKLWYLEYFMHRVNLLHFYKITPIVVFDGWNVPCKAATKEHKNNHVFFLFVSFNKSSTLNQIFHLFLLLVLVLLMKWMSFLCAWIDSFRAYRELTMVKLKEGNIGAASEIFQVVAFLKFKKNGFLEDIVNYY